MGLKDVYLLLKIDLHTVLLSCLIFSTSSKCLSFYLNRTLIIKIELKMKEVDIINYVRFIEEVPMGVKKEQFRRE